MIGGDWVFRTNYCHSCNGIAFLNIKMHDAYEETSILNISVQIESMAAYDDNLLIGTREGHLLMYNVPSVTDESHKLELLRHSKNFNKKRITQIDVVPEYNLLIILTEDPWCHVIHFGCAVDS